MNNTSTLFVFVLLAGSLFFPRQVSAQAPDKMSYQAVIRDASDQLVTNQEVGLRVSILQNSIDGTLVYQEIYNPNPETNNNGLLTIEIGAGVPLTGTFSEIDWSDGPYFLKTETDPSGGNDYTITGTSQLLSVPYALHSGTAEILTGEITESQITDLQNYLTEETDPVFTANFDIDEPLDGDLLMYDSEAQRWVVFTPDYAAADHTHDAATNDEDGFMSADDKNKLDAIEQGAQVNVKADWNAVSGDAEILNRPESISDFALDAGNQNITNLANPVNDMDAATKAYVDNILKELGILPDNYAGTISDIEGNTYRTVTIGTQTWMSENLRASFYEDGTPIEGVYDNNDDPENTKNYGKLYTWNAVMNGVPSSDENPSGVQGVCPASWHVPGDAEWTQLIDYLSDEHGIPNESVTNGAGNALKAARQVEHPWGGSYATEKHPRWSSHDTHYGTDAFGFSALPGGVRDPDGNFINVGGGGGWWSSTEHPNTPDEAWSRTMGRGIGNVNRFNVDKDHGFSVRCVRDID